MNNEILFSHEKEEYPVICNNVDGPTAHDAKRNKSNRERQVLYDFAYMAYLKNKTNEQAKQIRNNRRYVEQKRSCQRAGGSGRKEIGDGDIRGIIFQSQINFK